MNHSAMQSMDSSEFSVGPRSYVNKSGDKFANHSTNSEFSPTSKGVDINIKIVDDSSVTDEDERVHMPNKKACSKRISF